MKPAKTALLVLLLGMLPAAAQPPEGELAKIKERELEEVRDRIADLKKSMDANAAARDRLAQELQQAEIVISEKRIRLKELEREREYSVRRKAELDQTLAAREAELDDEAEELAEQLRAAYMSGRQIMVLDEPSMGLAPLLMLDMFDALKEINRQGTTILLVEQNARLALKFAQRGYVLEHGQLILAGEADGLLDNPEVKKAYLGA